MASVWRGRITFGLVSIPVKLEKAARRERISFRHVKRAQAPQTESKVLAFPSGSSSAPPAGIKGRTSEPLHELPEDDSLDETVEPVRLQTVSGAANEPVSRSEILKGYEVSKDQFVVFEPEEIKALRPRTSSALELTEFVKLEDVDPAFYETSYYVEPDTGGEKPYTLLFAAMKETRRTGVGSFAMHGRERIALVRAGRDSLMLHTLFYANEVGRARFRVGPEEAVGKEVQMAKLLVEAMEAKFEPEKWKSAHLQKLTELIESRTPVEASTQAATAAQPPAADILEALRKSLEVARKPVATEQGTSKSKRPARRK